MAERQLALYRMFVSNPAVCHRVPYLLRVQAVGEVTVERLQAERGPSPVSREPADGRPVHHLAEFLQKQRRHQDTTEQDRRL